MANLTFSSCVLEHLKYYVYRLVDPRNDKTFYVGKGYGNRVFQHIREEIAADADDLMSLKLDTIRAIKRSAMSVKIIVHRHGIEDDRTAFAVEAALIDAYVELSNKQTGRLTHRFGRKTLDEIEEAYACEEAEIVHKVMIIDINKTFGLRTEGRSRDSVYDAVRFQWKAKLKNARRCDYVLAQRGGVIVGIFKPDIWLEATPENFPEFIGKLAFLNRRIGFRGSEVTETNVTTHYLKKRIPKRFAGSQIGFRYVGM